MTNPAEIARQPERSGDAVIPNRMDDKYLAAAARGTQRTGCHRRMGPGLRRLERRPNWCLAARKRLAQGDVWQVVAQISESVMLVADNAVTGRAARLADFRPLGRIAGVRAREGSGGH